MSDQNDHHDDVTPDENELNDEQLNDVSGGFNPQPDPPRIMKAPTMNPSLPQINKQITDGTISMG
jgi:hypothetical protein